MRKSLWVLLLALAACKGEPKTVEAGPSGAPPQPQGGPGATEQILAATTLPEAIALAKPHMTDVRDDISPGARLLARWSMKHLKLSDVHVTKDETSFALVQKDPDEERGKRLCYGGTIVQIHADKSEYGKGFSGILMTRRAELFRFFVAGSSGRLIEDSWARLCGVVIGNYTYANSGGGTGHAVYVVGMFDLPENRASDPTFAAAAP